MSGRPLRLGTRGSALALAQTRVVAGALTAAGVETEVVEVATGGDRGAAAGDKSRWVDGLEAALTAGDADLAVHSAKDVPGVLGDGLAILGVPEREDPSDALCGAESLDGLPPSARVGTTSLRRRAQLLTLRDDLQVVDLRGNVDTRLRKLAAGEVDAAVLALAGLRRLDRAGAAGAVLSELVPAAGQGALILEGRTDDVEARRAAEAITDSVALAQVRAERALVAELGATCHTPVGASAEQKEDRLEVRGFAGLPDGSRWVRDRLAGPAGDPEALGRAVAARMAKVGAVEILHEAAP